MDIPACGAKYWAIQQERKLVQCDEPPGNQGKDCGKQHETNANNQRSSVYETLRYVNPE